MAQETDHAGSCLGCGYALRGLPETGACPECGLPYDPHSRVILVPLYAASVFALVLIGMLGVGCVYLWRRTGFAVGDVGLALVLIVYAFWVGRALLPSRRYCRVEVNHTGVTFKHPRKGRLTIPWSSIQPIRATVAAGDPRLILRDGRGATMLNWTAQTLGGSDNVIRCAAEIQRGLGVYAGAAARQE